MKGAALAPPFSCTTKYSSDVYSPRPPDIRVRLLPTKPPVHFTTEQPGRDNRLQQWTQIIQQCKSSGLTNKAFCAQNGISEKTYYYWLKKMRTALAEKEAPHIIRLEDTPTDEPEDMIHIRFRSANMTLPAGTNVQAIAAVLQSLQQL